MFGERVSADLGRARKERERDTRESFEAGGEEYRCAAESTGQDS